MLEAAMIACGLLGAIFIHEAAHCLTARALGWRVTDVGVGSPPLLSWIDRCGTRWQVGPLPLRGCCHFAPSHPDCARPAAEKSNATVHALLITAAGPVASLLLGVLIYLVAAPDGIGERELTHSDAAALGISYFSLLIGLFNLLPVPPLDGGRMWLLMLALVRGTPAAAPQAAFDHMGRAVIAATTVACIALFAADWIGR